MNIIILTCENVAGNYGVGSYEAMLIHGLRKCPKVSITEIRVLASTPPEFSCSTRNGIKVISIPRPLLMGNTDVLSGEEAHRRIYSSRVISLLRVHMQHLEDAVIHLNYHSIFFIAQQLREEFAFPIVLVTHVLTWKILSVFYQAQGHIDTPVLQDRRVLTEATALASADRLIFITAYGKEELSRIYNIDLHKTDIVYNGLTLPSGHKRLSDVEKQQYKIRMGFPADSRIILFCGRIDEAKGIYYLLGAFRQILKEMPDTKLVIIGGGDVDGLWKAIHGIWHNVIITGYLSRKEVYDFYRIAEVGVVPSLHEQCSYVALEMMLHELPVVVSSADGLGEMFENRKEALVINVETKKDGRSYLNENTLAAAILELMEDRVFACKLATAARRKVLRKFSLKLMTANTMAVYKAAVSGNQKRDGYAV